MMIYPALYGLILAATGSYEIGFALAAIPSFAAFVIFLSPAYQGSWFGICRRLAAGLFSRRAMGQLVLLLLLGAAFAVLFQTIRTML
ncbi:MAG: hypothetical protein VCE74_06615 [Alphaproteobacteria bacterium]|jgi:hypothetical protein